MCSLTLDRCRGIEAFIKTANSTWISIEIVPSLGVEFMRRGGDLFDSLQS